MVKQSLTWKKFLLPRLSINLDNRRGISMRLWRVPYFDLWFLPGSTFSLVLQKLSPISQSTYAGPILYFIHCYKHFTTLLLRSELRTNLALTACKYTRSSYQLIIDLSRWKKNIKNSGMTENRTIPFAMNGRNVQSSWVSQANWRGRPMVSSWCNQLRI